MSTVRRLKAALLALLLGALVASCNSDSPDGTNLRIHLQYQDSNGPRNVVRTHVEVWKQAGGWSLVKDGKTDANGVFAVAVPFVSGATYALRLFPWGDGAQCCFGPNRTSVHPGQGYPQPPALFIEPLTAEKQKHQLVSSSAGEHLDWGTFLVDDPYWAPAFNIVETMRLGYEYVSQFRDATEAGKQPLLPAHVARGGCAHLAATSCMYPVTGDVFLTSTDNFDDAAILHEYAHWVQYSVGSLAWIASTHSGCSATNITILPAGAVTELTVAQLAWMEGFADWFSVAVQMHLRPTPAFDPRRAPGDVGESNNCPDIGLGPGQIPGNYAERHVGNMLVDLSDPWPGSTSDDAGDRVRGREADIIRVMDQELGTPATSAWPTASTFYLAMRDRMVLGSPGAPEADLADIYHLNRMKTLFDK